MRTVVLISAWVSAINGLMCLIRLSMGDWPVTIKWEQWEYALRVATSAGWAALCFWLVYGR
jgi:hypothetical protein